MRLALEAGRVRARRPAHRRPLGRRRSRAATRSSRRSPGCAGRWAIRRRSSAATAATGSRSTRTRSTRCACCATPPPPRRRLDAGDARGAAELSAAALALFRGEVLPAGRRLGRPAPGTARGGARAAHWRRGSRRGCALGDAVDRRARGRRRGPPVPGTAVGAADHRALPRGPPGRRARGLPAGPRPARRRARPRARAAAAGARAAGPRPRPGAPRPDRAAPAGNLPSLSAELVGRDEEIAALSELLRAPAARRGRRAGRHRQDGASPIATGRALAGVPGGVWLARLEAAQTADDVLDTVIAALGVTGGEAALLERLRRAGARA